MCVSIIRMCMKIVVVMVCCVGVFGSVFLRNIVKKGII